ncbi:23S rRNA (adenine(1618)-N(6))-methyltransferase RlmF [Shewanella sp. Isolate7]|uniref:23S rRNA (adenine(1618)-N(6))-methyltransferase RlmF n=1 Tax=Shewanella sp. Isolate7 TaxID=2908528 RepID=UPI001EFDF9AA|nr:23S rRNA (adenine(1618)-N(6))-methyltransferase RlmF [Shewanella sp. Isolate7]MCG9721433.1 23S rRNA (adenine(1618)-N(6))-methyltransferase RlmF [Shewanella sp. Isolate7]
MTQSPKPARPGARKSASQASPSRPAKVLKASKAAKPSNSVKTSKPKQKAKPTSGKTPRQPKGLHERNLHAKGYDFNALMKATPALRPYVRPNPYGNLSIDFADPKAVKLLNLALLRLHYGLSNWDIPEGFLCPPIPGRVDYLHYLADLLAESVPARKGAKPNEAKMANVANATKVPKGERVVALDIGTGANGIYPLLGHQVYGWRFVASDIDPVSLANVEQIIANNPPLAGKLSLRQQSDPKQIFTGIITAEDRFDLTLCNPPFHASLAEASRGSERKLKNLAANKQAKGHEVARSKEKPNFGGQKAELWCEGGELAFLSQMIRESREFGSQCLWFTSLVSKKENLKPCYRLLEQVGAKRVETLEMAQGNKLTRVLAWTFLTQEQHRLWSQYRV